MSSWQYDSTTGYALLAGGACVRTDGRGKVVNAGGARQTRQTRRTGGADGQRWSSREMRLATHADQLSSLVHID